MGNQYRYPRFQFDLHRKRIHPLVEHAHRALECDLDPWGTLAWWFTDNASSAVNGRWTGSPTDA
ncbi:hypothetical protein NJ76_17665 [Rhodococcus sp. IITR03]|nr:hypothetical protein NJ76_17665 [Rhodococcus sp. IITR03]